MRLGIALLAAAPCLAQGTLTLVPPSELSRERERLEEAWKRWQAGDARLERQLFSRPPEKVLPEIDRGERNALSYYRRRRNYLEALLGSFREQIRELEAPVATRTQMLRELDDARRLGIILEEQSRLAERVGPGERAGTGSLLDAEEQARQLERLRGLADKVEAQRKIVQLLEETEREQAKARAALLISYRDMAGLLERQLELNEQKQDLWRQYYDDLRHLVAPQTGAPVRKKEN